MKEGHYMKHTQTYANLLSRTVEAYINTFTTGVIELKFISLILIVKYTGSVKVILIKC